MQAIVLAIETENQTRVEINQILHDAGCEAGRWVEYEDETFIYVEVPDGQTDDEFKARLLNLGIHKVETNDE